MENSIKQIVEKVRELEKVEDCIVIAISGFGGSGKTTFSKKLANQLPEAIVINVDDFVENRGQGDGWSGGFDWDRLEKVLKDIKSGKESHYQRYDWKADALSPEWIDIKANSTVILDGVRIFQPRFMPYFDLSIWMNTDLETSTLRGIERDRLKWGNIDPEGLEKHLENWHTTWKPKETEFLNLFHPDELATIKINT